jgi:hypothetical protein
MREILVHWKLWLINVRGNIFPANLVIVCTDIQVKVKVIKGKADLSLSSPGKQMEGIDIQLHPF